MTRRALVGPDAPALDGHKGVPLRFDASGILEQPAYIIDAASGAPGKIVKNIP